MNTQVRAGDIYISGGREKWGPRIIHFGTRKGALGIVLGIPLTAFLLLSGLYDDGLVRLILTILSGSWMLYSILVLEGRSWADHAMVFIENGVLGTARCVEASMREGVRVCTPRGRAPRWVIFRVPGLTQLGKNRVATTAHGLAGEGLPYRMKLNVAFGLDYVLGLGLWNVTIFRRNLITRHANVCSVLVWRVFRDAGIDGFEDDPRFIDPDHLWDIGTKRWLLIGQGGPLREGKWVG